MSSALRILLLADSRSFHTARYVHELNRVGCEVLLASLEDGPIEHHSLRRKGPLKFLHYPLAAAEVSRLVRVFKPDIINPHFASGYGFLAALAARLERRPILLHLWGSDILIAPQKSFLHRRKTRLALETADFVVGDSDYLIDEAAKIGRLRRRRTVPWGIEREFLSYFRTDNNWEAPLKIIVPRPHEPIYNNRFIVRALSELIRDGRIEIVFPGWGSETSRFVNTTVDLTGKRPTLYQPLPRPVYLRFATGHHLYLSAAKSDSSPASLLEAMGLGLIPVAGDIPGVREWLTPDSGYLFDLADESTLFDMVSGLLENDQSHELMRQTNREKVAQKAVFEDNIAATISIMRALVSEK
jgi:glycosyltransferase involved in cell wall biosynthesis